MSEDDFYREIDPENEKFAKNLKLTHDYNKAQEIVKIKMEKNRKAKRRWIWWLSSVLFLFITFYFVCFVITDCCRNRPEEPAVNASLLTFQDLTAEEFQRLKGKVIENIDSNIRFTVFASHIPPFHKKEISITKEKTDSLMLLLTAQKQALWSSLRPTLKALVNHIKSLPDTSDEHVVIVAPMPVINKEAISKGGGGQILSENDFKIIESKSQLKYIFLIPQKRELSFAGSYLQKALKESNIHVEIIEY